MFCPHCGSTMNPSSGVKKETGFAWSGAFCSNKACTGGKDGKPFASFDRKPGKFIAKAKPAPAAEGLALSVLDQKLDRIIGLLEKQNDPLNKEVKRLESTEELPF